MAASTYSRSVSARRRDAGLDLGSLNDRQRQAVLHEQGPLLVLAGAGSGKTRVIIYRIARLLGDGVEPETILGMTFTNKAAREMRERMHGLVGPAASRVDLLTFHALGLRVLKAEHEAAGLPSHFAIYDTGDQLGLVRELLRRTKTADRRLDAWKVLEIILRTKRERKSEVALDWGDDYELAAYDLYPRYVEEMRTFGAIDFDDLILRTQDVFDVPEIRARWSSRYAYLLVDEYQDTSPDQLALLKVLAGAERNVCVVGDDDQSIYAWRGAAAGNILAFDKHFAGAREVVLDQNYRSTNSILKAANAVIVNNKARKEKQLWSAHGDGEPVEIVACGDGDDEATFVVEKIGRLLYDGVRHDEIAVLYRSNAQSRIFEETLRLEHIPYRVVGGQSFFDRKEVRDALAYLAVAFNPHDEVSLRRIINVPARGLGPTSVERLAQYGVEHHVRLWDALQCAHEVPGLPKAAVAGAAALVDVLRPAAKRLRSARPTEAAPVAKQLFDLLGLRDAILGDDDAPALAARRLENLDEVVNALTRFEQHLSGDVSPLGEFLRSSALARDPVEDPEEPVSQVTLMTLHGAKGLEFPFVFMVGVEEDLLPHKRTMEIGGELSEERRLCYVGITRAKRRLWLTYARHRLRHGRHEDRSPSRFLSELPEDASIVRRIGRDAAPTDEQQDDAADAFFKKMRAQLGIDE